MPKEYIINEETTYTGESPVVTAGNLILDDMRALISGPVDSDTFKRAKQIPFASAYTFAKSGIQFEHFLARALKTLDIEEIYAITQDHSCRAAIVDCMHSNLARFCKNNRGMSYFTVKKDLTAIDVQCAIDYALLYNRSTDDISTDIDYPSNYSVAHSIRLDTPCLSEEDLSVSIPGATPERSSPSSLSDDCPSSVTPPPPNTHSTVPSTTQSVRRKLWAAQVEAAEREKSRAV